MIDTSRFSHGVRCVRRLKSQVIGQGESYRDHAGKTFDRGQLLLQDDKYYYFTPVRLSTSIGRVLDASDAGWNTGASFGLAAGAAAPESTNDLAARIMPSSVSLAQLDKVLKSCMDLGRVDMAWETVRRHLDLPTSVPVSAVLWAKFPHRSDMSVMTSRTTAVAVEGEVRRVIESVWILAGGWHGTNMYQTPADEYTTFMESILNPYRLANVHTANVIVPRSLHSPYVLPEPIKAPEGRKSWVHKGILYLADADGSVLPYWYTTSRGKKPETIAWDKDFRKQTAARLGLSLNLARRMCS